MKSQKHYLWSDCCLDRNQAESNKIVCIRAVKPSLKSIRGFVPGVQSEQS